MNREFVKNSEPLFGVKFAVDSFANAAFGTSWLLGVAVSEGDDTAPCHDPGSRRVPHPL